MREILFRGKRIDNGEWVEGFYVFDECPLIVENLSYSLIDNKKCQLVGVHPVIIETVGQYTGLTDKNGKRIFEGDIIRELDGSMDDIPRLVRWDEAHMVFKCPLIRNHWAYGNNDCAFWLMQSKNIEIIGNIHDHPELLKGGDDSEKI